MLNFTSFFDDDLAQYSYAVACDESGETLIVDPLRDVGRYIDWAADNGFEITQVAETHIHADFLSGARELAVAAEARLFVSGEASSDWTYENLDRLTVTALRHGDEFKCGEIRIRAEHTPGHTPEHLSYSVIDDDGVERILLTGDFMFVDDLGRPDLLETAAREEGAGERWAAALFDSVTRFTASMPPEALVYPGHGAGSACGKSMSNVPVSSVGREARAAWWAKIDDRDEFVDEILADQPETPGYFGRMKELNRDGMEILGGLRLPPRLHPSSFRNVTRDDRAIVVDLRGQEAFASGHAPGSLCIALENLSSHGGWVLPYDRPLALICEATEVEEATRKLIRVGFDRIGGWISSPEFADQTVLIDRVDAEEAYELWKDDAIVLDVRARSEFDEGHIPDATHIHFGELEARVDELDDDLIVVHCMSGIRATLAASILLRRGFEDVFVFGGGPTAWESAGYPIE